MIKFFRRIRRKLVDEGNLKRYLIYGVGEILLVVIGILIALQINNKNIKKIQKETIQGYYTQLIPEFNSLIKHEENQLEKTEFLIGQIKRCQQLMNQKDQNKVSEFKSCLPYLHTTWQNRPQYPIFQEFMDEGWMSKIDNDSTKSLLISLREKFLLINEMDGIINKKFEEITSPFFAKNINRSELPNPGDTFLELEKGGPKINYQKLYGSIELWGLFNEKHGVTAFVRLQQEEIIKLLSETIEKLESNI